MEVVVVVMGAGRCTDGATSGWGPDSRARRRI